MTNEATKWTLCEASSVFCYYKCIQPGVVVHALEAEIANDESSVSSRPAWLCSKLQNS